MLLHRNREIFDIYRTLRREWTTRISAATVLRQHGRGQGETGRRERDCGEKTEEREDVVVVGDDVAVLLQIGLEHVHKPVGVAILQDDRTANALEHLNEKEPIS